MSKKILNILNLIGGAASTGEPDDGQGKMYAFVLSGVSSFICFALTANLIMLMMAQSNKCKENLVESFSDKKKNEKFANQEGVKKPKCTKVGMKISGGGQIALLIFAILFCLSSISLGIMGMRMGSNKPAPTQPPAFQRG